MNLRTLRTLAKSMQQFLGTYWEITVYTQKEADETFVFDPPCAYLKASCMLGEFLVCVDGEVYMHDVNDNDYYFKVEPGPGWCKRVMNAVEMLITEGSGEVPSA